VKRKHGIMGFAVVGINGSILTQIVMAIAALLAIHYSTNIAPFFGLVGYELLHTSRINNHEFKTNMHKCRKCRFRAFVLFYEPSETSRL
jgi:hypothetical protein